MPRHKQPPPPPAPPWEPTHGRTVGSYEVAVSYERATLVNPKPKWHVFRNQTKSASDQKLNPANRCGFAASNQQPTPKHHLAMLGGLRPSQQCIPQVPTPPSGSATLLTWPFDTREKMHFRYFYFWEISWACRCHKKRKRVGPAQQDSTGVPRS